MHEDRKNPVDLPSGERLFCPLQSSTVGSGSDYLLFVQLTATPCPLFDRKITSRNQKSRKTLDLGYNPTMKGSLCVLFGF